MTIRETAIAKLQQLSEPHLQEVTDFIDFVIHKHQVKIAVDCLDVSPPEPVSNYQQLLLNKYR
ncbi:hypothetical protein [Nostoc sp.]|uniref:hypothetical protein n=1 Tax=Nostoc sp. TaxID=1180 RepID=UPI002FFA286A